MTKPKYNYFLKYILAAGLAVTAGKIIYHNLPQIESLIVQEISFSKAKHNPSTRSQYLEKLSKRIVLPEGVKALIYRDDVERFPSPVEDGMEIMRTTFDVPPYFRGTIHSFTIEVSREAFDVAASEEEFLSVLVDHEFHHVKMFSGNIPLYIDRKYYDKNFMHELRERIFNVNGDLFLIFHELEAYKNQIEAFPSRKLSKKFMARVRDMYAKYYNHFEKLPKTPLVSWMQKRYALRY